MNFPVIFALLVFSQSLSAAPTAPVMKLGEVSHYQFLGSKSSQLKNLPECSAKVYQPWCSCKTLETKFENKFKYLCELISNNVKAMAEECKGYGGTLRLEELYHVYVCRHDQDQKPIDLIMMEVGDLAVPLGRSSPLSAGDSEHKHDEKGQAVDPNDEFLHVESMEEIAFTASLRILGLRQGLIQYYLDRSIKHFEDRRDALGNTAQDLTPNQRLALFLYTADRTTRDKAHRPERDFYETINNLLRSDNERLIQPYLAEPKDVKLVMGCDLPCLLKSFIRRVS